MYTFTCRVVQIEIQWSVTLIIFSSLFFKEKNAHVIMTTFPYWFGKKMFCKVIYDGCFLSTLRNFWWYSRLENTSTVKCYSPLHVSWVACA